MATEEIGRRRSPIPPYNPQLILEAIDVLNEKEGANISAISKYIESKYGDLPIGGHSNLLSVTLYAMKETGEIIFLDNNYLRPNVGHSVRLGRGRGRRLNPKDPLAAKAAAVSGMPKSSVRGRGRGRPKKDPNGPSGEVIFLRNNYLSSDPINSVCRTRGRLPKPKDPLAEAAASPRGRPKSRGRPKIDPIAPSASKKQKLDPIPVPFIGDDEPSPPVSKTGRPRGRPVKASIPVSITGSPQGRPIKATIPVSKTGRPRGRPMKVKPQDVISGVGIKGHANLLSATLYEIKKKNLGPDQYNRVSHSRGSPPKPKDPLAKSSAVSYPPNSRGRGRGRPKKDLNVPPSPKKPNSDPVPIPIPIPVPFTDVEAPPPESKSGRPRRRPIKAVSKTGKPSGRPIKVSTPVSKTTGKPPGRPIKVSTPVSKTTGKPRAKSVKVSTTPVSKTGKPRGRPRKVKPQAVVNGVGIIEGGDLKVQLP